MTARLTGFGSLAVFVALVAAAASFGATFRPGAWYAGLEKPFWTPPNWVFAPVWTILYVMIAVAGWLVWRREGWSAALYVWGLGLVLNMAWSWLFFGQHWIGAAAIEILLLWLAIAGFMLLTARSHAAAFWLFVPYSAWVSYATSLNLAIWMLNR